MIGRNNPFNIRYDIRNKWLGQSGYRKGFCNFRDVKYGVRAAAKLLIESYAKFGKQTYAQKIETFAPSSENPTSRYVQYVCDKCKVLPFDCPKTTEDYATMLYYMWCFEQGKSPTLSIADIEEILCDIDLMFD